MNKEEIQRRLIEGIRDSYTLNLAISILEDLDIANKKLDKIEKYIEKNKQLEQQLSQLQQENEAMKQLIEWISECDFGFDNFVNDYEEDINMTEEEFDKETENMSYIESMIHYAKLYISKLKESDKDVS